MTELFDKNGNATETCTVKVSGYDSVTGEITATYDVRILAGTGMPRYSTMTLAPVANDGCVVCWDGSTWNQVEDLRGKIAYKKSNLTTKTILTLVPLDDAYTLLVPATTYDKWDGTQWVTDVEAQHAADVAAAAQMKTALRSAAAAEIEWRQYAVDKGIATDEESAALDEWNMYLVKLMRIDTSNAPDIEWPATPSAL